MQKYILGLSVATRHYRHPVIYRAVAGESRPEQSATYRVAVCWFFCFRKQKKMGDASNVKAGETT